MIIDKNNNLLNKSKVYETKNNNKDNTEHKNIFSDFYLIGFILLIGLCFIGYAIYIYKFKSVEIQENSSFYGEDVNLYEPLFNEQLNTINDCIDTCKQNIICDGITYNSQSQMCSGTKNGLVRNDNSEYSAWVKPKEFNLTEQNTKDFKKAIIVGHTKTNKVVNRMNLQNPYRIGYFSYSFNLTIYDFYKNYGSWRHVFHKGTEIEEGSIINYQSWENLVKDFPIQSIGVWLAPFTNNLRIAVTTQSETNKNTGTYSDAFVKKCNDITEECYITDMPGGKWADTTRISDKSKTNIQLSDNLEFFDNDLQNIPINKEINITITFKGTDVEVYYDGKIVKVVKLDGLPIINKSNLYAMNDKTFGGEINNLIYYPDHLTLDNIKNIIELKPIIENN